MLHSDDPDVRDNAIVMLGRYPNTSELCRKSVLPVAPVR